MSGPLSSWATGFASSLVRQGYTRNSAISQMQLMAHLSRWLASEGVEARKLRAADAERFLRARRGAGYTHHLTGKALQPLLAYLLDLGVLPTPPPATVTAPVDMAIARYRSTSRKSGD